MIYSCDVNAANLFFLEKQGKIVLHTQDNYVFKHYEGTGNNRNGWLFPGEIEILEIKNYLNTLLQIDSSPNFILLTEEQRKLLENCVTEHFPQLQITFKSDDGDSDYIYNVEKMANLPGKDFQKKRNHISRFRRTYGDNWKFQLYNGYSGTVPELGDLKNIYLHWKQEHSLMDDFLQAEENSLDFAINPDLFKELSLIAGVLYIHNKPSAFLLASFTEKECLNVHFEKCLEEVAVNGGLAILNQQFAMAICELFPNCKLLNREEDLNIPGLRKSKLSYKPEFMIKKYYGKMVKINE